MHEKHLFEYAVIRIVPCVEREEFLNIGVILFCPALNYLETKFRLNSDRINSFAAGTDHQELEQRLLSFVKICSGRTQGGAIGQLSAAQRFRWLTASRSTVVQTSKVHPGLCSDPEQTLNRLLEQLVL